MNIEEILNQTSKKLYPQRAIFALEVAFTEFLKELEKEDTNFKLLGCKPSIATRRIYNDNHEEIIDEKSTTKILGNYASFIYNGDYFYIQFDKYNPLFECYFQKLPIKENKIPEGCLNEFNFYSDCELYTNTPNIKEIKNKMMKAFKNKALQKYTTYKGTDARKPKEITTKIYFN